MSPFRATARPCAHLVRPSMYYLRTTAPSLFVRDCCALRNYSDTSKPSETQPESKDVSPESKDGPKKSKLWDNGQVIRVRFLDGDANAQKQVEQYAKEWEKYANIKFNFVRHAPSEIRISFNEHEDSCSMVGNDALSVPEPKRTMNFQVISSTSSERMKRVVLHEFGHALGCVHEHSSPTAKIPWNKDKTYAYYKERGWSQEKVDSNVFEVYDENTVTFSKFDPKSIMIYDISKELTDGSIEVPYNTELSKTDKLFIAQIYPMQYGFLRCYFFIVAGEVRNWLRVCMLRMIPGMIPVIVGLLTGFISCGLGMPIGRVQ